MRSAIGVSFMCHSFLPNEPESMTSVSATGWAIWALQCTACFLWLGKRQNSAVWCSNSYWLYIGTFKESWGWLPSWKLPAWILNCSPKYCWLSDHWRKKGNNQFPVWHWGEILDKEEGLRKVPHSGFGFGLGLFIFKGTWFKGMFWGGHCHSSLNDYISPCWSK